MIKSFKYQFSFVFLQRKQNTGLLKELIQMFVCDFINLIFNNYSILLNNKYIG